MSAEHFIIIMLGIAMLILLFGLWTSFHPTEEVYPRTSNRANSYEMDSINKLIGIDNYRKRIKRKNCMFAWHIAILSLAIIASIVLFLVFYSEAGSLSKIIVCISIVVLSYLLYIIAQRKRRYLNALRKLELLILRLKLDIDKDLKSPYRLDRELEMIYRIIES